MDSVQSITIKETKTNSFLFLLLILLMALSIGLFCWYVGFETGLSIGYQKGKIECGIDRISSDAKPEKLI